MTTPLDNQELDKETLDKWNESDMLMRWPPEFLEIVGKHSSLWNYSKGETLLMLDEWLQAYISQEAHRIGNLAIGEDEDLNAPAETYGKDDQSLGDNPFPNPNLQYVVRRATRNVQHKEQRQKLQKLTGVIE
jgi:hypothetical protein